MHALVLVNVIVYTKYKVPSFTPFKRHNWDLKLTRKPHKRAAVIAASMHGFANCRKFKSPVRLTLTLDRIKITSTYTVHLGLPAYPTM